MVARGHVGRHFADGLVPRNNRKTAQGSSRGAPDIWRARKKKVRGGGPGPHIFGGSE